MSVNLDWYKSCDKKWKNSTNANLCFLNKIAKKKEMEIFPFCVITIEPIRIYTNLDQLRMSKWPSEPQFCEKWTYIL